MRTTTHDDPALHQGRTRQIPHKPGHWPSHVYVEWHPGAATHGLLASLVASLGESLRARARARGVVAEVTSLLHSELAAPLPLHISLSRPLVLAPGDKDAFLREVEGSVAGCSAVTTATATAAATAEGSRGRPGAGGFGLVCTRAEWHRTAESGRSFLVLRVRSRHRGAADGDGDPSANPNPELTELLRRCNAVAARFGQPELYKWAEGEGKGERHVGEAFHVSIAWSFAEPTEELLSLTEQVFGDPAVQQKIQEIEIPVEGVKVKIGNVVTHVPLPQPGRRASEKGTRNLLGL